MRRVHKEVTLRTGELGGLKRIFQHAVTKGWLDNSRMPVIRLPKPGKDLRKEKRRPAFMPEEWDKVVRNMVHHIESSDHPEVRADRRMLAYYMLIMANTGMRPTDEHAIVKWKHVQEFKRAGRSYCRVWIGDQGSRSGRITGTGSSALAFSSSSRAVASCVVVIAAPSRPRPCPRSPSFAPSGPRPPSSPAAAPPRRRSRPATAP